MELTISHKLVTTLTAVERTLTSLPRTADHTSFYRKRAADVQLNEIITLAETIELPLLADDAKLYLDSPITKPTNPQQRLLFNMVAVMKYTKTLREGAFTSAVLQHINKLISDGFTDFWEEGKHRAAHEAPLFAHDSLRNRPPNFTYSLWTELRQVLSFPDNSVHPFLLASMTVYHLIYAYPFLQFNLQTALLSAYAIVKPTRYWSSGVTPIMTTLWKQLQRTDFTFDSSPEHFTTFAEKVSTQFLTELDTIDDTLRHQSSIAPHIRATLNDRQLKILTHFKQFKKITRLKYAKMMNVAIATAFRDLNDLYTKGLITSVGKGRGTCYHLADIVIPEEKPLPVEEHAPVRVGNISDFDFTIE